MMEDAPRALQQAVYQVLVADSDLETLIGGARIYDHVPQGTGYPYVTIGENLVRDWSTSSDAGAEHSFAVHIWSRAPGRGEAHNMIGLISALLHDQQLTLSGHRLVNLRQQFSEVRRDPDGRTFHGVMRFRATTEIDE